MPSADLAAQRFDSGRRNLDDAVALLPTPTAGEDTGIGRAGEGGLNLRTAVALLPDDQWVATLPDGRTIDYGPAVRRWAHIFGEPTPAPRDDRGRLNPDLPRWMMGYPRGWLDGLPRTAALRCAGNGCQPQAAWLATRLLLPELCLAAAS